GGWGLACSLLFCVLRPPSACLASRRLAAPERFGNQRISDDELGLGHFLDRQHNLACFAGCGIVAANARGLALHAEQQTVQSPSAVDRRPPFHPDAAAGPAP